MAAFSLAAIFADCLQFFKGVYKKKAALKLPKKKEYTCFKKNSTF
jgi:hypothetical protein